MHNSLRRLLDHSQVFGDMDEESQIVGKLFMFDFEQSGIHLEEAKVSHQLDDLYKIIHFSHLEGKETIELKYKYFERLFTQHNLVSCIINESKLIQLQIIESHRDLNTIYSVKINYRGPNVGICAKPFQPAAARNEIHY